MKNLQLSLKKQWFDLTKSGVKTEDYREITPYWCSRLFNHKDCNLTVEQIFRFITYHKYYGYLNTSIVLSYNRLDYNIFENNIMTLGYPKATDSERILRLEHKGIEIRTGNPEWGAEPNKLYFVIKHGGIL